MRLICWAGTTQEITSAGRMKIASTRAIARKIDLGKSLAGFSISSTCTAFISMPEYARKLFTMSTRPASPLHAGSRWWTFIGAAE